MPFNKNEKEGIQQRDDTAEKLNMETARIQFIKNAFNIYSKIQLNFFVALIVDYVEENEPHLFCGQIGEVSFIINETTCFVKFYDYTTDYPNLIHQLEMEKFKLFPLFFMDPNITTAALQEQRTIFAKLQATLEKKDFKQAEQLIFHKKSKIDLPVNQLVTVGTDFVKNSSDDVVNDEQLIQAGQVGRILSVKGDGFVEVIFECQVIGSLIDLIKDSSSPISEHPWQQIITIHQDYLFPLYYENLNEDSFDFSGFLDFHKNNTKILEKFSLSRYSSNPFFIEKSYDDSSDENDEDISD